MDLGDLFVGMIDVPTPSSAGGRDKSPPELACLLFLPLVELVVALLLGLAAHHPIAAMLLLPLAFGGLAYAVTVRTGNGVAAGLWTGLGTFGACFAIGGASVLLLGIFSFFQAF